MISSEYKNVKIKGLSAAVSTYWEPIAESVSKANLKDAESFNLEKFVKTTAITGRWISQNPKQTTSDFCFKAADEMLSQLNISREEIGILVFVTQTADYRIPATACLLQHRLSLNESCICFDVNLGYSGYVYGLNVVSAMMANTDCKYGLLLCGDTGGRSFYQDREVRVSHSSSFLFGDTGTATLLENDDNLSSVLRISSCTDGAGYKAIIRPYGNWRHPGQDNVSFMDDIAVFNFSTTKVPAMINQYMQECGRSADDYDGLILHQANYFIMKQIAKKTGFPIEKLGLSIDTFGNTSSSSIPITVVKMLGDQNGTDYQHYLTCGFGVGLSWAAAEINLNADMVMPLLHTDDAFNDEIN